jgi:DNA-binding transcriptional MerR regulator
MITIGQLAGFAGVTIKAVRHYHQRGLLAEPPRDASGYRRYGAEDAAELIKIKTLADAGVPLARIRELLAADPDEFAAAIADIDRSLRERADELRRSRERIAQLSAGDRLVVTPEVADYLDRLRETGVSQRSLRMERDLWILMQAVSPREAASWLADKRDALRDPEFVAIYVEHDAAFDWSPDDPRLYALADRTRRWMTDRYDRPGAVHWATPEPAVAQLVATAAGASSPAWDRLSEIAAERAASEAARHDAAPGTAAPGTATPGAAARPR